MYKVGDFVVKIGEGVCRIVAIEPLDIAGMSKDELYFHLVPEENKTVKLFLPEQKADECLRNVITKKEALDLIQSIKKIEPANIIIEKQRDKVYRQALLSSNPQKLVSIIKSIYLRNKERLSQGKNSAVIDERFFKMAEERLYGELAFALEKNKNEIKDYIKKSVE